MAEYYEFDRIWKGVNKPHTYGSEPGLGKVLIDILEKTPNKITQINDDSGIEITCDEVRRKSIRVASSLSKMGFKKGDVMMIAASNGPDVAPVLFGCFLIGAPINPIDVTFGKGKLLLSPSLLNFNK